MYVCLYVCLSICSHILKTTCPNITKFSARVICERGSVLLWRHCNKISTSGFVDDVTFSHTGTHGAWRWQYPRERRAAASSHNCPTYLPGGSTLHVWICSGSKLRTGGEVCYLPSLIGNDVYTGIYWQKFRITLSNLCDSYCDELSVTEKRKRNYIHDELFAWRLL